MPEANRAYQSLKGAQGRRQKTWLPLLAANREPDVGRL
jgi:hypothetical protein